MSQFGRHLNEPLWRPQSRVPPASIPRDILSWLTEPDSLTRRLQLTCDGRFEVQVVSQGRARPLMNEARALGMGHAACGFIRQVRLLCDGRPWVFARSVIPARTLTGRQRRLARLGRRPLGALLFSDPTMRRDEMEIACLRRGQGVFVEATRGLRRTPDAIWGRRSVFYLEGKPLLVSEIFLPGIP